MATSAIVVVKITTAAKLDKTKRMTVAGEGPCRISRSGTGSAEGGAAKLQVTIPNSKARGSHTITNLLRHGQGEFVIVSAPNEKSIEHSR